jgi:putative YphP/YqiW family bacilliredoxin
MLLQVEGPHAFDGRGHLLPVGAHILHRCPAHRAGNARQALDARAILQHRPLHKSVPVFAGRNAIDPLLRLAVSSGVFIAKMPRNPTRKHQAIESGVGDQQIAAAAQHKQRNSALAAQAAASAISSSLAASANQRAGPPMPKVVKGASGLFSSMSIKSRLHHRGLTHRMVAGNFPLPEAKMYPELMVIPMREELVRAGFKETRTAEDVDAALAQPGTTLLVVNSICGCAAGKMRPGVRLALTNSANLPDHKITVFAGQDREATERARSYFEGNPPSSPPCRHPARRQAGLPDAALRHRAGHRPADRRRTGPRLRRVLRNNNSVRKLTFQPNNRTASRSGRPLRPGQLLHLAVPD